MTTAWASDNDSPSRRERVRALAVEHAVLLRYGLIGATAAALDVVLFALCFDVLEMPVLAAHAVSVATAVLFSFFSNAYRNFRVTDQLGRRLALFATVCLIGFWAGYGVIEALAALSVHETVGKLASLPVVFAIQFKLNASLTFRETPA